ncbi:nucleotide disphospho-sugar-binding domain-containing protein [Candidatus Omnitrophota bacterium]
MNTIAFFPATWNLAETTRTIDVAKVCRQEFNIFFASYGGQFEKLIEDEGFTLTKLEPRLTQKKIDYLYKVDQGDVLGSFFSLQETRERVRNEVAFLTGLRPVAAVTGFNTTLPVSSRASKIPLVWLSQSTWDIQTMMDQGLGSYTDDLDVPVINLLPDSALKWITKQGFAFFGNTIIRPLNDVAREYGVKKLDDFRDVWKGDYNLLAEPPDFSGLKDVPESYSYIGPLIANLKRPVPEVVQRLADENKPLVYFSMGSSGKPNVIKTILEGFKGQPFNVISPMKSKIKDLTVSVPPNVTLTDWLPALEVSRLADISVIHGGIGTVMTAALAGKPVVGIGMMYEQEYNIECLVRKGYAKRIRRSRIKTNEVTTAIKDFLTDEKAKEKARLYAKHMEEWLNLSDQKIKDFFRSL